MRSFGYIPDPEHVNEKKTRYGAPTGVSLPSSLDLTKYAPEVEDQSSGQSCVGYGLSEIAFGKQMMEGLAAVRPSAGFIWWNSRRRHSDEQLNVGTYPYTALETLNELGLCPESNWPNRDLPWRFAEEPDRICYTNAYDSRFEISSFKLDASESEVKSALVSHGPLGFGMAVYEGYTDLGPHELVTGPVGEFKGQHYQAAFGYDEQCVFVLNSWGRYWGNAGWARISWGYFLDAASDLACFKFVPVIG